MPRCFSACGSQDKHRQCWQHRQRILVLVLVLDVLLTTNLLQNPSGTVTFVSQILQNHSRINVQESISRAQLGWPDTRSTSSRKAARGGEKAARNRRDSSGNAWGTHCERRAQNMKSRIPLRSAGGRHAVGTRSARGRHAVGSFTTSAEAPCVARFCLFYLH